MTGHTFSVLGGEQFSRSSANGRAMGLVDLLHKQPERALTRLIELWSVVRQEMDEKEARLSIRAELECRVVRIVGVSDGLFFEAERIAVEASCGVEVVDCDLDLYWRES